MDLPTTNSGVSGLDRTLAHSWLLVLFAAPIIIVLLVWLLILLRRRLEQTRHLVSGSIRPTGCLVDDSNNYDNNSLHNHNAHNHHKYRQHTNPKTPCKELSSSSSRVKSHHRTASNAHYLLESSPGTSTASSSTSSSSAASTAEAANLTGPSSQAAATSCPDNHVSMLAATSTGQHQQQKCGRNHHETSLSSSMECMRSLVDHMNLYLVTMTYQEIIGCLVAFTIAILNIVRMRNLFCCNLVIFVLITSKVLNLLTLTTFSATKLIKLFHVKPFKITTTTNTTTTTKCYCLLSNKVADAKVTTQSFTKQQNKNVKENEESRIEETSTSSSSSLSISSSSGQDVSIGDGGKVCIGAACPGALTARATSAMDSSRRSEPIACRLLVLVFVSSTVALVCLYLRLMPASGPLLLPSSGDYQQQHQMMMRANNKSTDGWSISIYAPTTTTETSTRYSSDERPERAVGVDDNNKHVANEQQQQQQQPNYQATWSARFQQSSHLRHLIDQYELQNFMNLLLDTQLQTSRFMCTLSTANYAPLAKLTIMTIYALLMLAILAFSVAIQQVGRRKLNQFEANSRLAQQQQPLPPNYPTIGHHHYKHHQYSPANSLEFPPSILFGQKQTDSNRKRYSELLKQNIQRQHHQSSLEMSLSSGGYHRRSTTTASHHHHHSHQRNQMRSKLRNSSSMSSLLIATPPAANGSGFSASVDRYPQQQQHHQVNSNRVNSSHLRRLISAQSMANLSTSNAPQRAESSAPLAQKIPAGKLASSGGQLAWLPLGSAATVASLSNIGRCSSGAANGAVDGGYSDDTYLNRPVGGGSKRRQQCDLLASVTPPPPQATNGLSTRRSVSCGGGNTGPLVGRSSLTAAEQQQQLHRERLDSIGEHLVDCVSLDERDEKEVLDGDDDVVEFVVGSRSNVEQQQRRLEERRKRTRRRRSAKIEPTRAATGGQHQQLQTTANNDGHWPLYSNQQQAIATKNRLNYVELKRDLQLAQSVILFGQLLNHAPILLLLALANLLPDGLINGWNSSHDNGFVWLTLIEALALPLLLCTADSRLGLALRRSLKCNKNNHLTKATSSRCPPPLTSHLSGACSANTGARLANFAAFAGSPQRSTKTTTTNGLVLGPSASYPDFMFVCSASRANQHQQLATSRAATTGPPVLDYPSKHNSRYMQQQQQQQQIKSTAYQVACHSLTGPPYPLIMNQHAAALTDHYQQQEQPLAIDTNDSLRANFALMTKGPLGAAALRSVVVGGSSTTNINNDSATVVNINNSSSCIGTNDLMASRRARYSELIAKRRRGRTSAILSATRSLFSFGRPSRHKSRTRHASSGYLVSSTASTTDNNTASSRGGCGGGGGRRERNNNDSGAGHRRRPGSANRMSPTSSLSTLIRKFNHDNYTSVCQQYEQRKQQIAVENNNRSLERQPTSTNDDCKQEEVLIDGLDGPISHKTTTATTVADQLAIGGGGGALHAPQTNKLQATTTSLLDEDGIFCRKGGLFYNYCLNESTVAGGTTDHAIAGKERVSMVSKDNSNCGGVGRSRSPILVVEHSRINPMLNSRQQLKQSLEERGFGKLHSPDILLNKVFHEPSSTAVPVQSQMAKSVVSCAQLGATAKALLPQQNMNLSGAVAQSSSGDGNIVLVEQPMNSNKQQVAAKTNKEDNTKGVVMKNSSNKNGKNKRNSSNKRCSVESSAAGNMNNNSTNSNNETIISNITSVQELLDKMNGIMAKQQVDVFACGGRQQQEDADEGRQLKSGRNNKTILQLVAKNNNNHDNNNNNNNNNKQQSDTCANQLRQWAAMAATSGGQYNVYDSLNRNTLDTATLDYASLRSIDDALSLVSVSSEFEYHNISSGSHGQQQQQQRKGAPTNGQHSTSDGFQVWHQDDLLHENDTTNQTQPPITGAKQRVNLTCDERPNKPAEKNRSSVANSSGETKRFKVIAHQDLSSGQRRLNLSADESGGVSTPPVAFINRERPLAEEFGNKTHKVVNEVSMKQQEVVSGDFESKLTRLPPSNGVTEQNLTSASSSSVDTNKRLEDLRFPSFLPTKGQQLTGDEVPNRRQLSGRFGKSKHAPEGSGLVTPPRMLKQTNAPHNQQHDRIVGNHSNDRVAKASISASSPPFNANKKTSSSLLNLTTAKFAALNNNNTTTDHQNKNEQPQTNRLPQQLGRLPPKVASSSNTITKQRAPASTPNRATGELGGAISVNSGSGGRSHVVTLGEFCSRNNLDTAECSLPAESGNVRARIRKMEQQSTPNMNTSQHQQQQVQQQQQQQQRGSIGAAKSTRQQSAGSMIPVTSGSKLPVLAAKAQLATRSSPQKLSHSSQRLFLPPNTSEQQRKNSADKLADSTPNKQH